MHGYHHYSIPDTILVEMVDLKKKGLSPYLISRRIYDKYNLDIPSYIVYQRVKRWADANGVELPETVIRYPKPSLVREFGKTVVTLRDNKKFSMREIAQITGLELEQVKSIYYECKSPSASSHKKVSERWNWPIEKLIDYLDGRKVSNEYSH